jgi:nitroreductase
MWVFVALLLALIGLFLGACIYGGLVIVAYIFGEEEYGDEWTRK